MSDHLKVLGVTLDSSMTLDTQVTATVRACNFHLQSSRQLRSSLLRDVAQSIACAIIGSRLDYCNSLYYGCQTQTSRNCRECRGILLHELLTKLHDAHITQSKCKKDVHWLSVRGRVDYKIAVLCYKAVELQQPSYFCL